VELDSRGMADTAALPAARARTNAAKRMVVVGRRACFADREPDRETDLRD
jgi:hypothetical protein